MTDNLRLSQRVNAYYIIESTYGTCPVATIYHAGLLDTFDPRNVEMQYTPVPAVGKSTDSHIISGPVKVTVPFKIGMWGTGWKDLLGRVIGVTSSAPSFLTDSVDSVSLLADEVVTGGTPYQSTLVTGCTFNSVVLEADYTSNAPITLDFDVWGYYLNDKAHSAKSTSRNFDSGMLQVNLSGTTLPGDPTTDPILPTDMTVYVGSHQGNATQTTQTKGISIDGPLGRWVEVGERYIRAYSLSGALNTDFDGDGSIDLTAGASDTISELSALIEADSNWGSAVLGGGGAELTQNLVKGIYDTGGDADEDESDATGVANIYVATDADATGLTTEWPYLKTVKLTITNNLMPIPGRQTANSITKHLHHANVTRGKADILLDVTATAKDETFFDYMNADATIPLIRLDLGTNGSIALTNGKVMSRTAPYTAGGEVVETIQLKFTGAGDIHDWSKYAISADWATN